MSQEFDGLTDPARDNLDQLIQGFQDAELSGAFLLEPEFPQISHNEDATERESAPAAEDIEPSCDAEVSYEANEPVLNSSAPATRQDVSDQPPLSSDTIPLAPPAEITSHDFGKQETPDPQFDCLAGIPRDKVEFEMCGRRFVLEVDDLKKDKLHLGEGGFGTVIKVKVNGVANAAVAVKRSTIHPNHDPKYKKLCRELTTMQTVARNGRCPHIITYYGALVNTECFELCLLLKLMDTSLLQAYQKLHERPFTMHMLDMLLRRVAYNVVSALNFIYGHGLSHNDVKPANILLSREGDLVLADFGECDDINDGKVPQTNCPGTAYYWPPEYTQRQIMCSSVRSNLYALGLTLVEICLGNHPYGDLDLRDFALSARIRSWTPILPPDTVSIESVQFIRALLHVGKGAPFNSYIDILNSPYLADMTSVPSREEIDLFRMLIERKFSRAVITDASAIKCS